MFYVGIFSDSISDDGNIWKKFYCCHFQNDAIVWLWDTADKEVNDGEVNENEA